MVSTKEPGSFVYVTLNCNNCSNHTVFPFSHTGN